MAYILMAEDNIDDVDLFLHEMDKANLHTALVVARDIDSAKARIAEALPSLVILDLKLEASQDGLEVLRHIRSHTETEAIPVIVLTESRAQQNLIDTYNLGVKCYLKKPILYTQLIDAIIFILHLPWLLGEPDHAD